jgi:hypothetical protein
VGVVVAVVVVVVGEEVGCAWCVVDEVRRWSGRKTIVDGRMDGWGCENEAGSFCLSVFLSLFLSLFLYPFSNAKTLYRYPVLLSPSLYLSKRVYPSSRRPDVSGRYVRRRYICRQI